MSEDFDDKQKKMFADHSRFMWLVENAPPPTEEQKKEVSNAIEEMRLEIEASRRETEERTDRLEQGRVQRQENDPKYWRELYENLSRRIALEKKALEKKKRDNIRNWFIFAAICGAMFFLQWLGILSK